VDTAQGWDRDGFAVERGEHSDHFTTARHRSGVSGGRVKNQFVYIVGPPGVGKYTVGSALVVHMSAKLVDNHYWLNPVFGLIRQDGMTPLPREVWVQVKQVRAVVLETIATLSPSEWNFVFTHAFVDRPGDYAIAREIFAAGERRSADILWCG